MQNKKVNKASTDVKLAKAPDVKAEVKQLRRLRQPLRKQRLLLKQPQRK